MTPDDLKSRAPDLLATANRDSWSDSFRLFNGTLSLMTALYGSGSIQVKSYVRDAEQVREKISGAHVAGHIYSLSLGALKNLIEELDAGFAGTLQKTITAEVLTDHVGLSRRVLEDTSDDAKNVAAVLAAAAFEDTIRRLATSHGIPHFEKLADVVNELKIQGVLQGSQIGIANSYLNFVTVRFMLNGAELTGQGLQVFWLSSNNYY